MIFPRKFLIIIPVLLSIILSSQFVLAKNPPQHVSLSIADLVEKLSPAVVNIRTTQTIKTGWEQDLPFRFFNDDEFFRRFFGEIPEREYRQTSLGSGFIISSDGYILTNNHVVAKAEKIKVKLRNGEEYDAEVVGKDPYTDLALIKITTNSSLPTVTFGDSDKLRVGDWVFAIGNPFGLESTVTMGIVSAKGRVIGSGPYDDFIQTDASINPGNSGGPLFNLQGEVVGINTAIVAQAQGIGFAVPINIAKMILGDLKTKGYVTRGWLGISVQEITPDIAQAMKLGNVKGVLISQVFEGDPADKAGIKAGDIVTSINGREIASVHDLMMRVAALPVGKKVKVKLLRDGKSYEVDVVVGRRPDTVELDRKGKVGEELGIVVQEITPEIARILGVSEIEGVFVKSVKKGSPAEEAGIKVRDIITEVNRIPVRGIQDFNEALKKTAEDGIMLLKIKRGDISRFVTVRRSKK